VLEAVEGSGIETDESCFFAATILACGTMVGLSASKIAKTMGYKRREVYEVTKRLRASNVWTRKNEIWCEWFDEHGALGFTLDAMAGEGTIKRSGDLGGDEIRYENCPRKRVAKPSASKSKKTSKRKQKNRNINQPATS
jgi:hypothetical protein